MTGQSCDFDLHGIVGIRLLDATAGDVAKVRRQLGPLGGSLEREPDITVRFVDHATTEPLTYVGLGDAGYSRDGFFVLRGKGGVHGKARVPFADIARAPEILCERRLPAVPHLLAIVNLTALAKGVLPLHASAFTVDGLGVLVTGWAKSGKTECLLAALNAGASYVGDEWVYLTADRQMWGVPEPIRLWDWHLRQMPHLLHSRPRSEQARLAAWRSLGTLAGSAAESSLPGAGIARRGAPIVARQAYVQVAPQELFGSDRVALHGSLDSVVLVMSHQNPETTSRPADRTEVSGRMLASLADERSPFLQHYRQFRYAFPNQVAPAVEHAQRREARLLAQLFDDRPAAVVAHPYPCDIRALGRVVLDTARGIAQPRAGEPRGAAS